MRKARPQAVKLATQQSRSTEEQGRTAVFPWWRDEPYRILFPLGLALAWAGVLHWLFYACTVLAGQWPGSRNPTVIGRIVSQLALVESYRPVFHSIAQIEGFLMCFAMGFLLTAIPRRTATPPPANWEMLIATLAPLATVIAAWYQRFALSQLCWLIAAGTLIAFALRRLRASGARRPPNSFVWIPMALAMGIVGSLATGALGMLGPEYVWLHDLGRMLLLQGMFLGLVAGVGGLALPLFTRGEAPADAGDTLRDRLARLAHAAAAALLVASFVIETFYSVRWAMSLRAVVLLAELLATARIWRAPLLPGLHRRMVWLAAWMIPLGYALAALYPEHKKAGMHVVFISGFAAMALSVAAHVVLGHGERKDVMTGRPWQMAVLACCLAGATLLRVLVDFDRSHYATWLGGAAAAFLTGSLFWALLIVPEILRKAPLPEQTQPSLNQGGPGASSRR